MTKHAFLVGVAEYDSPTISPVHFAVRDAEAIGGILRDRCGFRATILLNPVAGEFARSLGNLMSVIEDPDDLFCFFYAGHGVVYENDSYLLLRDAFPEDRVGMYQLSALRDRFARLRSENRLVFLDCCRNDPRGGRGKEANLMSGRLSAALNGLGSRDIGLAASGGGGGSLSLLLKACAEGERAYEWEARRHGVFSWFLKEGLEGGAWRDGALSAHHLCEYVATRVRDWAGRQGLSQRPDFHQYGAARDIVLAGTDPAEQERGRQAEAAERRRQEALIQEAARKAAAEEVARLQREAAERERRAEAARQAAERQAEEAARQAAAAARQAEATAGEAERLRREKEELARKQREAEERAKAAEKRAEELARAQAAGWAAEQERERQRREVQREREAQQRREAERKRQAAEAARLRQAEKEAKKRQAAEAKAERARRAQEQTEEKRVSFSTNVIGGLLLIAIGLSGLYFMFTEDWLSQYSGGEKLFMVLGCSVIYLCFFYSGCSHLWEARRKFKERFVRNNH